MLSIAAVEWWNYRLFLFAFSIFSMFYKFMYYYHQKQTLVKTLKIIKIIADYEYIHTRSIQSNKEIYAFQLLLFCILPLISSHILIILKVSKCKNSILELSISPVLPLSVCCMSLTRCPSRISSPTQKKSQQIFLTSVFL